MKYFLLFTCLLFLISPEGVAQDKGKKMANIMKTYHNYNMFDGAVLVAEKGKIIYQSAFGLANREWNIPNTVETKFMLGSVSKPLTAVLMLIQIQKGLIQASKSISYYLPEFLNKPAAKVTIRQLLNHTSGIQNYDIINDFFPRISRQHFTREAYLKIFMDSALAFEPGTKYSYSSWGYFTLGYIMERVTGKTYAQLMKDDIFDKTGMSNSGSYFHTQVIPKRASGYDYSLGGYTSADFRDQSNTMGTGDIYSTVGDLFKFHLALSDNSLLNKELTEEMFTPGIRPAQYGYGWFNKMFKYTATDSVESNFHLGTTEGFLAFFRRIPSNNSVIIILCNAAPTDFFGITENLGRVLFNKPVYLKKPIHKVVENTLGKKGAQAAVQEFNRLQVDTAHYYVDWISMNYIAEQLQTLKQYDDARIISENNAKAFPNRDLVMVTMANIYLAMDRKQDAIKYYKKALEIYPGYEEARNKLKQLENNP
ncbi:MAG: serine hydrolase [Ferruginibacter sp.]